MATVLPDVSVTVTDGGLGILPQNSSQIPLLVGTSSSGQAQSGSSSTSDVIVPISDMVTLKNTFGSGPLVDAAAYVLSVAGGPAYCVRIFSGSVSAGAHTGTGTATVPPSGSPMGQYTLVVLATSTGALGTATFSYALDGATYVGPLTTPVATGTFVVPGTGITLTFGAGSWVTADTYATTVTAATGTANAVTHTGTGAGVLTTTTSNPLDAYTVSILITTAAAGNTGLGAFEYSLDGGRTYSNPIALNATYTIASSGVVLNFSNASYVVNDTYVFTTTGPQYVSQDLTNLFTLSLFGSPLTWGFSYIIGKTASPAACLTLATLMDGLMTSAFNLFRFTWCIIDGPTDTAQVSIDTSLETTFASFSSLRTSVGAGDLAVVSPATGPQLQRTPALMLAARTARTAVGVDPGRVADGSLPGVVALLRDENATPGLDATRFTTCRTILGQPGFYITNGRLMAPPTSDFRYTPNRRVMDLACSVARNSLMGFLNSSVRVVPSTGAILENDARMIENFVNGALNAAIVGPGQASSATCQVNRTANIISTSTLPVTINVVPLGYAKAISLTIGFVNPSQAVKAASN